MKRYLAIVYDEAKRSKPDALVMTHTPHPYLADVLDMNRLNDMLQLELLPAGVISRNLNATMSVRARCGGRLPAGADRHRLLATAQPRNLARLYTPPANARRPIAVFHQPYRPDRRAD